MTMHDLTAIILRLNKKEQAISSDTKICVVVKDGDKKLKVGIVDIMPVVDWFDAYVNADSTEPNKIYEIQFVIEPNVLMPSTV